MDADSDQSRFKTRDTCNQFLSTTHEIHFSLADNFEALGVFLDISKTFNKVWHERLIYKGRCKGLSGKLLDTLTDFLSLRKQILVINRQSSA